MTVDIEKVIKGIDICLQRFRCGEDCPYYNYEKIGCMEQLREDALELLKKQEKTAIPIIHEYRNTDLTVTQCGNCLAQLFLEKQKHCTECGSRIDWSI